MFNRKIGWMLCSVYGGMGLSCIALRRTLCLKKGDKNEFMCLWVLSNLVVCLEFCLGCLRQIQVYNENGSNFGWQNVLYKGIIQTIFFDHITVTHIKLSGVCLWSLIWAFFLAVVLSMQIVKNYYVNMLLQSHHNFLCISVMRGA